MTAERVAVRMQWLAYQASRPVGMGILHFATDKTEDDIAAACNTHSAGCFSDYIHGRMVKCYVHFDNGVIMPDESPEPRPDYQSWAGKYPTYQALYDAAAESLKE